jgi:purine-binding chemotaxis protein CheW
MHDAAWKKQAPAPGLHPDAASLQHHAARRLPVTAHAVVFAVGSARCALRQSEVRELLPVPHLWRPPGLPRTVEGFMNLGGTAVAVVSLARLFGLGRSADEDDLYRHLILLHGDRAAQQPVALLVSRVLDVTPAPPERLRPVERGETLNGCVEAEIETEDGFIHLLAAGRILLEQEKRILAELRQDAEARLGEWSAGIP